MLVDARVVHSGPEDFTQYAAGQALEGAEAEYQVAVGHAEVIPEPEPEPEAKGRRSRSESADAAG